MAEVRAPPTLSIDLLDQQVVGAVLAVEEKAHWLVLRRQRPVLPGDLEREDVRVEALVGRSANDPSARRLSVRRVQHHRTVRIHSIPITEIQPEHRRAAVRPASIPAMQANADPTRDNQLTVLEIGNLPRALPVSPALQRIGHDPVVRVVQVGFRYHQRNQWPPELLVLVTHRGGTEKRLARSRKNIEHVAVELVLTDELSETVSQTDGSIVGAQALAGLLEIVGDLEIPTEYGKKRQYKDDRRRCLEIVPKHLFGARVHRYPSIPASDCPQGT